MDIAGQIVVFARVVDAGNFSAAARDMALTPSAVSKQISRLEDHLGVRLLNRSTRRITLTEEGRAFYERARDIAAGIGEAEAMVIAMGDHPQGTLRIVSTVAFGKRQLMPMMAGFLADHPDLRCSLVLTDRRVDLVEDHADIAIRFTEQIEDEGVIARKVAHNSRVYCAAPEYVEKRGLPMVPEDLVGHNCLGLNTVARWNLWTFYEDSEIKQYRVDGNLDVNSADGIYHAALNGLGIARLSTYLVNDDIRDGRLVRVMPAYSDEGSDIYAVFAERRNMSPKIRAFIDALTRRFGGVPPWERGEHKLAS